MEGCILMMLGACFLVLAHSCRDARPVLRDMGALTSPRRADVHRHMVMSFVFGAASIAYGLQLVLRS